MRQGDEKGTVSKRLSLSSRIPAASWRWRCSSSRCTCSRRATASSPGSTRWPARRSPWSFLTVNAAAFAVTALVVAAAASGGSRGALLAATGWFAFLFFANAILHVVGTLAHGRYSPGTATAVLLYLPFFLRLAWLAARAGLPPSLIAAVTALCAAPMLVHGWRILFEGGRLF
jgi:uncharacterized protein with HXXEE motif